MSRYSVLPIVTELPEKWIDTVATYGLGRPLVWGDISNLLLNPAESGTGITVVRCTATDTKSYRIRGLEIKLEVGSTRNKDDAPDPNQFLIQETEFRTARSDFGLVRFGWEGRFSLF